MTTGDDEKCFGRIHTTLHDYDNDDDCYDEDEDNKEDNCFSLPTICFLCFRGFSSGHF